MITITIQLSRCRRRQCFASSGSTGFRPRARAIVSLIETPGRDKGLLHTSGHFPLKRGPWLSVNQQPGCHGERFDGVAHVGIAAGSRISCAVQLPKPQRQGTLKARSKIDEDSYLGRADGSSRKVTSWEERRLTWPWVRTEPLGGCDQFIEGCYVLLVLVACHQHVLSRRQLRSAVNRTMRLYRCTSEQYMREPR